MMELITSFDTTRQKILLSLIESYEVRERRAFQIAATQLVSPVDQIDILDARDEKVLSAKDPGTATVSNTTSCRRLSKDGVPATSIATIAAEVNSGDEITRTFPNPFGRPKAELAPTPSSNTSSNAPITSAPPPRISEVIVFPVFTLSIDHLSSVRHCHFFVQFHISMSVFSLVLLVQWIR